MRKIKGGYPLLENLGKAIPISHHDCNFSEVTKNLLTMCSAYQMTIALLFLKIDMLQNLLEKDLGYTEEELGALMPKGEGLKKKHAEIEEIIAEFMDAEGTVTGVKQVMKKWGFPVEVSSFQTVNSKKSGKPNENSGSRTEREHKSFSAA